MENKNLQKWGLCFLLILISGLTFQMEASTPSSKVKLEGDWKDIRRSVPFELPISAFIDGSVLTIQSSSTNIDIAIIVSQNGISIYEKNVPTSQTAQIIVDMSGWTEGEYVLVLRNKWGGYLYGIFNSGDFVYSLTSK